MNLNEYFQIGKIGKAKSFKGEVFLRIEDEEVFFAIEEDLKELQLLIRNKIINYPIQKLTVKNGKNVTVKFKGIDDGTMAELIKNCEVYIKKSLLPVAESDEVFTHEYLDAQVQDNNYGNIGTIEFIDKSSAQYLAYIKSPSNKELFFPLIDEFIVAFDSEKKILQTELPEGILEIND